MTTSGKTLITHLRENPDRRTHACWCPELGLSASGDAPVLELCRKIMRLPAGIASPDAMMEVYRGQTLALRVKSISGAATLDIDKTRFRRGRADRRDEAAE